MPENAEKDDFNHKGLWSSHLLGRIHNTRTGLGKASSTLCREGCDNIAKLFPNPQVSNSYRAHSYIQSRLASQLVSFEFML